MHLLIVREAVDAHLSVAGDIIDPSLPGPLISPADPGPSEKEDQHRRMG